MKLRDKLKVITAIVAWGLPIACEAIDEPARDRFDWLGAVADPALPELSGLAPSRRSPGRFWAINDSGNDAALVAIDADLRVAARVAVSGAVNVDWEDLASFEQDGRAWILIADTGDNFAFRTESSLIVVPEPEPGQTRVSAVRTIRFAFEDGPRDCEAVAVDAPARRVLLADKGRHPVGLYELPLDAPQDTVQTARRIASFPDLVPTAPPRVQTLGGSAGRGTATALDVSADGRRMAVLTYLSASLFERAPGQTWAQALVQPRLSQRLPREPMFEAMAFDATGRFAVIGSERVPSRFYRWSWGEE